LWIIRRREAFNNLRRIVDELAPAADGAVSALLARPKSDRASPVSIVSTTRHAKCETPSAEKRVIFTARRGRIARGTLYDLSATEISAFCDS